MPGGLVGGVGPGEGEVSRLVPNDLSELRQGRSVREIQTIVG